MNIFLPYEDDIGESVKALDDVRLNKQAVECYQLLTMAEREKEFGEPTSKGHYHHPVYEFYKENPAFLACYGVWCCAEYFYRFNKRHKTASYFTDIGSKYDLFGICNNIVVRIYEPDYIPYYMEGSKGQPNYIRTTQNVGKLFRKKLVKKWVQDTEKGRPPKWTNREVPEFYKEVMKGEQKNDD